MTSKGFSLSKITPVQVVISLLILMVAVGAIRDFREHSGRSSTNLRGDRLDLADRTGWQRVGPRSDVLLLVDEKLSTLSAFPFGHEPTEAELSGLAGGGRMKVGTGSPRPLTATLATGSARGWMRSIECADDGWLVVMYVELGAGEATHRDTIERASCLPHDAPAIVWPQSSISLPPRQ